MFAVYYIILIKLRRSKVLRHLNRGGTEDFSATLFVIFSALYIFILFVFFLKKIFGFQIPVIQKTSITPKFIIILLSIAIIYFSRKYFISDRVRRNKFIESFRCLKRSQKLLWTSFSIFLLLAPIWFLIFLILKKHLNG
jgi:hypothetical protein